MSGHTILVVEDSRTQAERVRHFLESHGYTVRLASNGREGLEAARAEAPDFIISDIVMPELDGYGMCRAIREDPALKGVPLLLLTSLSDPMDVIRGLESGADGFVMKPFDGAYLLDRIQNILTTRELRKDSKVRMGLQISFLGRQFFVTSEREQMLDMLLSVFEQAVRISDELRTHQRELQASTEVLRESEMRFRSLAQSAVDAFITADSEGNVIFWNDAARVVFGYEDVEVVGRPLTMLMPERYRAGHIAGLARLAEGGEMRLIGQTLELEGLRKDGSEFPLQLSLSSWIADGRRFYSAIVRDITEAKRAEAEIRALNVELRSQGDALAVARNFLEELIAASPSMVFRLDPGDLTLTYVSPNSGWLLGYTPEDMVGKPRFWEELIHPDDRAKILATLASAPATLTTQIEQEYRLRGQDGRYRWFYSLLRLEYGDDGTAAPISIVGYALDIADRKAAEEAARAARADAERANRAKSEFLSRMSHDLRTPLNSIIGFAQLLELDAAGPEQREAVTQIMRGGRHLLELINEVLDLARIEAGQLSLSPEPVAVWEAVKDAVELCAPLAAARDIALEAAVTEECQVHVRADRQRLTQVLLNLLSNAVKYNRHGGGIRVTCAATPAGRQIRVTDTGPGIPEALRSRLFTPFERLDAGPAIEGTGLGLAVSRSLAHAMGGRIGVDSEVGRGSTFWIELPVADTVGELPEGLAVTAAPSVSHAASGTVLYIEDNPANLRLIERVLARRPGVRLLTAIQGGIGLELARSRLPDMIFLDMHLPDMSGADVLQRLRAAPETAAIPVVVLSADATPHQIERQLAAGARAYLTKPLDINELLRLVDETLARRGTHRRGGRHGEEAEA